MQENLIGLLLADAGLSAYVGARIYWVTRPQGSLVPAIVLHVIGETRDYTHSGESKLKETRVQADILASTYTEAIAIEAALTGLTSGLKVDFNTTSFRGVFLDGRREGYEAGEAEKLFRVSIDHIVQHKEI